jgi:tRNA threonylcarbamoyladenosine biosynthesis protein TsaB
VPVLLAVDTSGRNGGIALARVPPTTAAGATFEILESVPLAGGTFSAQLIPQIADLLARQNSERHDIAAFVVVSGPGSFTGLRVGLAAIKALSEVLQKPIAAISLLEVIALRRTRRGLVMAALEAGRGEVYVGDYDVGDDAKLIAERLLGRAEFVEAAKTKLVITPDSTLAELARRSGSSAEQIEYPSIARIAELGWRKLIAGHVVSPADLEANYIRRSDAEIFSKPPIQKTP